MAAFYRLPGDGLRFDFKPRAPGAVSFTEAEITAKAEEIILGMRQAKTAGGSVMFYSAIIRLGPGQTKVAIELVTALWPTCAASRPGV